MASKQRKAVSIGTKLKMIEEIDKKANDYDSIATNLLHKLLKPHSKWP